MLSLDASYLHLFMNVFNFLRIFVIKKSQTESIDPLSDVATVLVIKIEAHVFLQSML